MSFMTSNEMTTGSVSATEPERRFLARQTRWWNSTGGGSQGKTVPGIIATTRGIGAVKAGDGGVKFRAEWPELEEENQKWMKEQRIDPATGHTLADPSNPNCLPEASALRRRPGGSGAGLGAVVGTGQAARDAGQSWLRRHRLLIGGMVVFGYVLLARLLAADEKN